MKSDGQDEVDLLARELPVVLDRKNLPETWDEEWIFVPIENPDKFPLSGNEPILSVDQSLEPANVDTKMLLPEEFSGQFPGALVRNTSSLYPPPDALAFYLPFHFFYPTWWGIYLIHEGVTELARTIGSLGAGDLTLEERADAASIFLFGHEQFHHAMESFATRLEVTHRSPLYRLGFEVLYRRTDGTDDCLEEALANANGYLRVLNAFEHPQVKERLDTALTKYIADCPHGYRRGLDYPSPEKFKAGRQELAERAHREALTDIPSCGSELWKTFPHGFHPFRKRGGRINFLIHRYSPLGSRLDLTGRYFRYGDVRRQLEQVAKCILVREGKGSHEIWRTPAGRTFPVPRHPGDFPRGTLAAILRQAGLRMSVSEFMSAEPARAVSL